MNSECVWDAEESARVSGTEWNERWWGSYYHTPTICRTRLTSVFTFLRGLSLLGKAGVQPSCGLAVVAAVQRRKGTLATVNNKHT